MLITAKQYIKAIKYQYHNDPQFAMKLNVRKLSIDSFIVQVLTVPEHKRAFREQHHLWVKKSMRENRILHNRLRGLNDN